MKRTARWFESRTQQAVMGRVSTLPVIARTGTTARGATTTELKKPGEGDFIAGESVVGGSDKVRKRP